MYCPDIQIDLDSACVMGEAMFCWILLTFQLFPSLKNAVLEVRLRACSDVVIGQPSSDVISHLFRAVV